MNSHVFIPSQAEPTEAERLLNPQDTARFVSALFGGQTGFVNFRAIPDGENKGAGARNEWCAIGPELPAYAVDFARRCAQRGEGAFLIPAPVAENGTKVKDVLCFPWLPVDMDQGDPAASLSAAEAKLGPADCVVESGGETEHGPKLHAYWKLPEPTTDIARVRRQREGIALAFGADPCMKQEAQVIRTPGSIHFKNGPKLVRLIRCP